MFRDVYKSANNDIIPDSQLLDKILSDGIRPKKSRYAKYRQYASIAAALLIFAGTLTIYPKVTTLLTKDKDAPKIVLDTHTDNTDNTAIQPVSSDAESSLTAVLEDESAKPSDETKEASSKIENQPKKSTASPDNFVSPKNTQADSGIQKPNDAFATAADEAPASSDEPAAASVLQADSTPEAVQAFDEPEQPEAGTAVSAYSVSEHSPSAASGGSSSYARLRSVKASISEEEAITIADEAFSSDFGEEFLNSTSIRSYYDNEYIITRYNDEESKIIIVSDDGTIQKQY